ncbi:aminotransferase [Aestuariispira insulae]|uniref:Adenosylmethionine-8-amino-7-oxononanoate aminotransferase n=1 Tax=Aestuariispira insulae TaxID=1461337 RepID=A0A3D9H562_9PROT|nr:aminotransferase [Aestuariispira insulae]RED44653.1 adenosylmethionine-8-amino-7-oxononanoate aminotransferase [Aestuariispira insulae]
MTVQKLRNRLYDTEEIQRKDNRFLHPWELMEEVGSNKRTVTAEAEGIYLYDSEGNRLIDGPGGMWCVNIGHGRQEMADAISQQIMRITYNSPWSTTSGPAAEFAHQLAKRAPGDLNNVFFTTGGSTAVDAAVRLIQFYNNYLGRPEKKHFIAREKGYHGSTYISSSLSGKIRDKDFLDFETDLFHHIPCPDPLDKPADMSDADYLDKTVADLENMILEIGPDKVAAFVAEPILASGGVIVPPTGYHKRCLEVCRKYDVLYVSDEVVTSFGRLGHLFASEDVFGIVPDIITTAKGLTSAYVPMGAMLVSDRIISAFDKDKGGAMYANGYTYSGHPVAAVAGMKNLEIMERDKIFEHVREVGPYFQEKLQEMRDIPIVSDVRGMGLMGCVECLISDGSGGGGEVLAMDYDIGNRIDAHCQKRGLLVRPIINMCVMSPPLTITKDQIDDMMAILREGIEATMADVIAEGLWRPAA